MNLATIQRRGFALPVVIIVLLIVSMVAGVLLQRQASDRLVAEHRLNWYREHHAQAGLEEVINAWLRSLPRTMRLDEILDDTGRAMTIDFRDGTEALISITDGQGAILTEPSAVPPSQRVQIELIAARFDELVGESQRPLERRTVGPAKLSLQIASREAIEATASAFVAAASASDFARSVVELRESEPDGKLTNDGLTTALATAELEEAQAQLLRAAITLRPTLYFVTIELRPKGAMQQRDGGASVYFGGYIPIGSSRTGGAQTGFDDPSGFLSFGALPVQ